NLAFTANSVWLTAAAGPPRTALVAERGDGSDEVAWAASRPSAKRLRNEQDPRIDKGREPMTKTLPKLLAAILCVSVLGCTGADDAATEATPEESAMQNPLLAEWTGPYGGVPAFDRMSLEHLKPALEQAMQLHLAEIEAIAGDPEPPAFENTI